MTPEERIARCEERSLMAMKAATQATKDVVELQRRVTHLQSIVVALCVASDVPPDRCEAWWDALKDDDAARADAATESIISALRLLHDRPAGSG